VTELRIPPDGIIARRFADMQDGMKADQKRYLRDCLLRGMRDESYPQPAQSYKVKAIEAVYVRQRATELLPTIERVRAGEERLPVEPVQEALDF